MSFSDLGLSDELLRAVSDAGYDTPTPIQEKAIPYVLMGRDIFGCAQTGTGKTASFTLPMLDILHHGRAKARMPRSLILEPTRELAAQVADNFDTYGKYQKLSKALLIGGESMNDQIKAMDNGVDVLIATPGRLLDLFERGRLLLNDVKVLVIDEADRMLDMGFVPDVERIVSLLPKIRTTLMFSATMPPEIRRLADKFLMNPKEITVAALSSSAVTITQGLVMLPRGSSQKEKRSTLRDLIRKDDAKNAIIFCNRKRDVSIVHRSMVRHGFNAGQLHGDMSQPARMETLNKFKADEIRYLVCSDVAARGLDIPSMSHVFNFDVPTHAEDYVHRIGRTGRAGRQGHAYTIALNEDRKYIGFIEKLIGKPIPPIGSGNAQSAPATDAPEAPKADSEPKEKHRGRGNRQERSKKPEQVQAQPKATEQTQAPEKPQPSEQPQPQAQAQPQQQQKPQKQQKQQSKRSSRRRPSPQDEVGVLPNIQVKGMGEYTPAFLLRPIMLPKDDKEEKEE
ncbi:MAG: DEAD/DEAH box helicase, partial [Rhodospirillales bacterium]|nr:DEAD/DEAH box helicase [Rhodospirillales bacterium]